MSWHDFFYFSKGERRGLIVLLCLITIAGILLIWNNKSEPEADSELVKTSIDSEKSNNVTKSADSRLSSRSSGGKSSGSVSSPARNTLSKKNVPPSKNRLSSSSPSPEAPSSDASALSDADLTKQVGIVVSENEENVMEQEVSGSEEKELKSVNKKESVPERVKRLTSYSRPSYSRTEKFQEGTVVELNTADTIILKKIPGIGSAFAKRIVNYRNLLGGYYSVAQLSEVYGIDEEKYDALASWFSADPSLVSRLNVNNLPQDSLRRHPYINYGQAKVITQLRRQKGKLAGWENLLLLNEFTDDDKIRLQYYLSFE
jgi:DNA uptake protein ComE-like DNA-binding protein